MILRVCDADVCLVGARPRFSLLIGRGGWGRRETQLGRQKRSSSMDEVANKGSTASVNHTHHTGKRYKGEQPGQYRTVAGHSGHKSLLE